MNRSFAVFFAVLVSASHVASAFADEDAEARRLAKATLEVARQGLKSEQVVFRARELFWWSQRILFAELELAETPGARVAAFQAHLDRCKEFEAKINQLKSQGQVSSSIMTEARYFRVRAEYWFAKEKQTQASGKGASVLPVTSETLDRR